MSSMELIYTDDRPVTPLSLVSTLSIIRRD